MRSIMHNAPYYTFLAFTAVASFMVCGALVSGASYIKQKERQDAIIEILMKQPLEQVANLKI